MIIAVIVAKNQGLTADGRTGWAHHPAAGWAACAMVWLFIVHFGYSWGKSGQPSYCGIVYLLTHSIPGPCAWIVIAEIWPLSQRSYGISLGASSNWMNNFIVGQVTPDMIVHLKFGTYLFFGFLTFGGAAFIYFFCKSPIPSYMMRPH